MKRLTINQIEKFIQTLESTEKIDGDTENQKQGAISYLQTTVSDWKSVERNR